METIKLLLEWEKETNGQFDFGIGGKGYYLELKTKDQFLRHSDFTAKETIIDGLLNWLKA